MSKNIKYNSTKIGHRTSAYYDVPAMDKTVDAYMSLDTVENIIQWLTHWDQLAELRNRGITSISDSMLTLESALAVVDMSQRERDVYHARFELGLSVGETAGLLDITPSSVSKYTKRIAEKLVKIIATQNGGDFYDI